MKVETSELTGAALDWAVAKCEGVKVTKYLESPNLFFGVGFDKYKPSTNWSQGGPIIEREKVGIGHAWTEGEWLASAHDMDSPQFTGPTPLIAAMRCLVASKLGDEVEIPDEFRF